MAYVPPHLRNRGPDAASEGPWSLAGLAPAQLPRHEQARRGGDGGHGGECFGDRGDHFGDGGGGGDRFGGGGYGGGSGNRFGDSGGGDRFVGGVGSGGRRRRCGGKGGDRFDGKGSDHFGGKGGDRFGGKGGGCCGGKGGGGRGDEGGGRRGSRHAIYAADLPSSATLLGGTLEFCDAFFHIRATPEAGLPLCCLQQCAERPLAECEGRQTVIIARLRERASPSATWVDRFVARFSNRGKDHHAERVMCEDAKLQAALRGEPGGGSSHGGSSHGGSSHGGGAGGEADDVAGGEAEADDDGAELRQMCVYISVQPCHYSSSNATVSCTRRLLEWEAVVLRPAATALHVCMAYPYRAHWDPAHMADRELVEMGAAILGSGYGKKDHTWDAKVDAWLWDPAKAEPAKEAALLCLQRAREGTALLRRHLRALGAADWAFLASLAEPEVGAALAARAAPLDDERLAARAKLDRFVGDFLDRFDECVPCTA